jgi:IclR family transcriptional regulator, acetate operon repressor
MTDAGIVTDEKIHPVSRALDLLEIIQRAAPAGIRESDAAASLGVDSITASGLLSTLLEQGYASRMPDLTYTLGVRSLRLSAGWVDSLVQHAAAPMARISERCGETVYLLQLIGSEAVTLARRPSGRRAAIDVEIGPRYPLWATAAGRALLGSLAPAQIPALLPPEPYPAFTRRTKTTWIELSAAMTEGRRNGIYAEEGEIDLSLCCYAIPLLHGERRHKLALAVSFEAQRPVTERASVERALRREWWEFAWQI